MTLEDFVAADRVFARAAIANKRALLQTAAEKAAACLDLSRVEVQAALERREELGSTGLGEGVAIPHARVKGVTRPTGLLWTLKSPIDFDAVDGARVDLVFALIMPATSQADHLNLLALVARRFRDRNLVSQMRAAPDAQTLFRTFLSAP